MQRSAIHPFAFWRAVRALAKICRDDVLVTTV